MQSQAISDNRIVSLFESVVNEQPEIVPDPPRELVEYRSAPKDERDAMAEKFFKQEFIKEYLDKKWKIELHNRDSFLWMWDVYKDEKDQSKRRALAIKMRQFKYVISNTKNQYEALRIDFTNYPIDAIEEEQCQY